MKILGIDSSGLVASAAILSDDTVVSEFTVNNKNAFADIITNDRTGRKDGWYRIRRT